MQPGPAILRMLGGTLLRAGWWYQCSVAAVGLAALGVLGKIVFGTSLANEPMRPHIMISVGSWQAIHTRGWPWEFYSRISGAARSLGGESQWSAAALIGDLLVFALLAAGIVWLTRRVANSPRWSMRWVGLAVTIGCVVGAWLTNAYHRSQYDQQLRREWWDANAYPTDEYTDPRWFQQLVGEKGGMDELFYRLSDAETLHFPPSLEDRDAFHAALAKRRGLRRLWLDSDSSAIAVDGTLTTHSPWKDSDVAGLLQLSSVRDLHELNLRNADITSKALVGIGNCRDLRVLDLTGTRIGDEAIEYVAHCPQLTVLRLSGTSITDASLPTLLKMSKRMAIEASNTRIDPQQIKAFRSPGPRPFGWETKPEPRSD